MKTIEYYMSLPYRLEIVPDTAEAGFVAFYPELPGCITCGEDIYKAVANAVDAKKLWLLTAVEDGLEIKEPAAFDYADFMTKFTRSVPKRERVFA
ncbi:MAG: type II toxin-antitoxin system HicB family antitoxin [Bacteroidales bacterium]|nr:type II toxin-antitoxin system HicB family antitoxin [Bacteroidales bacterium]MBQ5539147.1 type II toxin-antitoxin system HicB family antitoxin [Bacteroidales bacterium]MEE3448984.1 type II toxin-antitoxin system HicB family antitoxin [Bacteroidales bacterium]